MKTLKILWSGLVNAYDGAFQIVLANIYFIFTIMAAPILFSFTNFWPALILLVVTVPAGFAGLYYTTFQVAASEPSDWKCYFEGARKFFWPSLRWTILNGIIYFSLSFYFLYFVDPAREMGLLGSAIVGLDLGIMAYWTLMQMLTFPLLLEQNQPTLRTALRNALVFLLRYPGISFAFLLPTLVIIIATIFFPPLLAFLTAGFTAYMGCYVVYYRIESELHPELFRDPKQER